MNCPKCGKENTYSCATGAAFLTDKAWVNDCGYCHTRWTDWQQAEIDRLQLFIDEFIGKEIGESVEVAELKQELVNIEDSFRVIATENNELEKELATEREKVAEAEALHDEIRKQGMIGWVRQMADAYRAKYPKGGGQC